MISPDFGLSGGEELLQVLGSNTETPNGIIVFLAMQNRLFSSAQHLAVFEMLEFHDFTKLAVFGQAPMWSKIMSGLFSSCKSIVPCQARPFLGWHSEGGKS